MILDFKDFDRRLSELSARARKKPETTQSESLHKGLIELDEVEYELEMSLVARCESLDPPGFPSGWRFRLMARAESRLRIVGAGEAVTGVGDASMDARTDPHGLMAASARMCAGLSERSLTRAWTDIQERPEFAAWRDASALEAAVSAGREAEQGGGMGKSEAGRL